MFRMLETRTGSPDGFALKTYRAGEVYDLPDLLAGYFLRRRWAVREGRRNRMTGVPPNPWGSCFDAAAHVLIGNDDWGNPQMCHGTGVANKPGQEGTPIAHAWIEFDHPERGRVAVDPIWLVAQPAERYRKTLQADYVVSYPKAEFLQLWARHNFPGPWDERVWSLTVEGKAAVAKGGAA